ncbi:hypothetical protein [Niallia sp. FSL W8-0635]
MTIWLLEFEKVTEKPYQYPKVLSKRRKGNRGAVSEPGNGLQMLKR